MSKPAIPDMNKLGCHRVVVTEMNDSGLSHVYEAATTPDALWLYLFFEKTGNFKSVRLMDSSGQQWEVGLHVSARLVKHGEKVVTTFDDHQIEAIHSDLFLEQ